MTTSHIAEWHEAAWSQSGYAFTWHCRLCEAVVFGHPGDHEPATVTHD